jgi:hypothetical protein
VLITASSGSVDGIAIVNVLPAPSIQLSSGQLTLALVQGSTGAARDSVEITNGGGGSLSGLAASVSYTSGQPTGWLTVTLAGTTAPTRLSARATAGSLAPGTYTATVNLTSTSIGSPRISIPVELRIGERPPAIALGSTTMSFRGVQGGTDPVAQNVTIQNSGGGTLTGLGASVSYPAGQPTGWLLTSLSPSIAPSTLTLSPRLAGLVPGTYNATVQVVSPVAENSPRSVAVTLIVDAPPPAIGLSATVAQLTAQAGTTATPTDSIAVTNAGGGTLAGLSIATTYTAGQPAGWLTAALTSTAAPAYLVLQARPGTLAAGTYTAAVQVRTSLTGVNPRVVNVTFVVTPAPPPAITLSKNAVSFASVLLAPDPPTDSVAITNGGGGSLSGLTTAIQYAAGQPTGWLTATLGATTAPTRVTLKATKGALLAGTYNATVEVRATGASNTPQTIAVTFQITAPILPPAISLSASTATFSATQGGTNPAPQAIDVTNSGGGTLDDLTSATIYTAGQPTGWLTAALAGPAAPTKLNLSAATGALVAGTYTAIVEVRSAKANNSPRTVSVTFQVNPIPAPAAPTGLQANEQGRTSILLNWNDNSTDETRFEVQRAASSSGPFVVVATLQPNTTQYLDTGLTRDTRYWYRIAACNTGGCSFSATVSERTDN